MRILLLNPPIYDFSAYDFWLKPLGLLTVAATLADNAELTLFDFLDRSSPLMPLVKERTTDPFNRGKFFAQQLPKPKPLATVPRKYHRFGIPREHFQTWLNTQPQFDAVLMQTTMTYWYPGVKEVIEDVRQTNPSAKIILGGPYATICPDHAYSIGADFVISASNLSPLYDLLKLTPSRSLPPWHLYPKLTSAAMKLTRGCPCKCTYCSVPVFEPNFSVKPLNDTIEEFDHLVKRGVTDIAFYDDALLFDPQGTLTAFLKYAIDTNKKLNAENCKTVNFHTPNALHAGFITPDLANLLVRSGFQTLYLGFESNSSQWQARTGAKVTAPRFASAVENLVSAGAQRNNIIAYLILGHPASDLQQLEASMRFVNDLGIRVMLAEFSPIPSPPDGELARALVDLSEPLNHNKTAWPITFLGADRVNHFKSLCHNLNSKI